MVKKIVDLIEVLKSDAKIYFFDIEDTILASNIFYDLIGYKEYCKVFLDLCRDVKIFDVTYLGKNYKRTLMQNNIPNIFRELRKRGCKIFALTSGYPSHQKKMKIKELGIKFDGFLFTRGSDKGPFLLKFLEINQIEDKCAFIDNHIEKIDSVEQTLRQANIDIELYLYEKEFIHSISMQDFVNYWANVIEGVKRGEVEKLKALLQKEKDKKNQKKLEREQENNSI